MRKTGSNTALNITSLVSTRPKAPTTSYWPGGRTASTQHFAGRILHFHTSSQKPTFPRRVFCYYFWGPRPNFVILLLSLILNGDRDRTWQWPLQLWCIQQRIRITQNIFLKTFVPKRVYWGNRLKGVLGNQKENWKVCWGPGENQNTSCKWKWAGMSHGRKGWRWKYGLIQ